MTIRRNNIYLIDDIWLHLSSKMYNFLDIGEVTNDILSPYNIQYSAAINLQMLMTFEIRLSEETITHSRVVYSVLDLFGDFGGLLEVITIMAAVFVTPIAEFNMLVVYAQTLFRARSEELNGKKRTRPSKLKFSSFEFMKAFL